MDIPCRRLRKLTLPACRTHAGRTYRNPVPLSMLRILQPTMTSDACRWLPRKSIAHRDVSDLSSAPFLGNGTPTGRSHPSEGSGVPSKLGPRFQDVPRGRVPVVAVVRFDRDGCRPGDMDCLPSPGTTVAAAGPPWRQRVHRPRTMCQSGYFHRYRNVRTVGLQLPEPEAHRDLVPV